MIVKAIKAYLEERRKPGNLEKALHAQLLPVLEQLANPVEIVASLDKSAKSRELAALLDEIASLDARILLRSDGDDARKPSFSVGPAGGVARVRFAAIPLGKEFASLLAALASAGGSPPRIDEALAEQVRAIPSRLEFETFITMSCQHCPDLVQSLNLMASLNSGITHTTIDGNLFLEEIKRHKIDAVPTVLLNGEPFSRGRKNVAEILARLESEALAGDKR